MPLSASAWVAASGWISDTTFGLMTTYFFVRSTGRISSSTSASASATLLAAASSPRTSETTLVFGRRGVGPQQARRRGHGSARAGAQSSGIPGG